ncbi:HlyD family efflux transporter periplasmic adaptor subunit [Pseudoalteromonas sp. OOF1S-7]|uniref:efflux RND transporter periplasmic adaptor subunit n=1 Tax=Pseudoalteromonas sp. OOF1S-7 TaxID=2917757 RepID=UPI001EF4A7AA|nr:HlyD family efflux transporter periplasmic adaptor subunit [Pseudoalteromonas sp. OOF1S-7]MCG7534797.1 HlyD family efflux transporter periplasmic adaptor subunit [Pseudoalteromonas sp. OOF1S-7]
MDKPIQPKFLSRRRVVITSIAVAFIAVSVISIQVFSTHFQASGKIYNVSQKTLEFSSAHHANFTHYLPLRGIVEPQDTIFIDAIDGGRVDALYVQEGELVRQGQALLKLSNTDLQLRVLAREAEVSEQINDMRNTRLAVEQNQLALARDIIELDFAILKLEKDLARQQKLYEQALVPQRTVETLRDELNYQVRYRETVKQSQQKEALLQQQQLTQLSQSIATLQSNLQISQSSLDKLTIRAPRDGQLTFMAARVGESKTPGERLGQVDLIDKFKVSAHIDEFYIDQISMAHTATIQVGQATIALTVSRIYPGIENGRFKVDFHFQNPSEAPALRLGQSLPLELNLSSETAQLVIENGAFMQSTAGAWAFVVSPDGRSAHKRQITLGRRNPTQVEVLSGLGANERLITSSYNRFADAEHLSLIP